MVGIICGVIGCFIILRGMALMGDAISHAVLPGVAISYMLGVNFSSAPSLRAS
ncbi:metal ABC transporter permease [Bacillus licheniformis]|nr:metal ABC transporter permease [Bacillus licheniformis]